MRRRGAFLPRRLLVGGFLLGAAVLAAPAVPAEVPRISTRPGGVVRWPGVGVESCGRGDQSWTTLDGTCWFSVDLLHAEGAIPVYRIRDQKREVAMIDVTSYPYEVQRITVKDSSTVDISASDLVRVRKEQAQVRSLWSLAGAARFRLPLKAPLVTLPEGGGFGSRRFFNDQPRSPHSGADFAAEEGTPVISAAPGRVAMAEDLFFSGQSVFVDHGGGLVSMYFHLSSIEVEKGQEVSAGEPIGRVGATGRATGPHLHFGLRWRGARVDPGLLLGSFDSVPTLP